MQADAERGVAAGDGDGFLDVRSGDHEARLVQGAGAVVTLDLGVHARAQAEVVAGDDDHALGGFECWHRGRRR